MKNTDSQFQFNKGSAKRARRLVSKQEADGADLIGGSRHIGSGALPRSKSDASSDRWQLEAKQTEHLSISIKLDWLDKITREARTQDKKPMMHIRFTNIPQGMVVEKDWVMFPAKYFIKD